MYTPDNGPVRYMSGQELRILTGEIMAKDKNGELNLDNPELNNKYPWLTKGLISLQRETDKIREQFYSGWLRLDGMFILATILSLGATIYSAATDPSHMSSLSDPHTVATGAFMANTVVAEVGYGIASMRRGRQPITNEYNDWEWAQKRAETVEQVKATLS